MNRTPDACMDEFTSGQYGRMLSITDEYRPSLGVVPPTLTRVSEGVTLTLVPDVDLTIWDDAVIHPGGSLVLQAGTFLRFKPGVHLIARGTLDAGGATFTEADAGQGWGGLVVEEANASVAGRLLLNWSIVEHAEIGAEVHSRGNSFLNTLFRENGTGIRSGYVGPCADCAIPTPRSTFLLRASCVVQSEWTFEGLPGYGIWATGTDATLVSTTVRNNDGHGILLDYADLWAHDVLVHNNGAVNPEDQDGVRVFAGGDLTLASYFSSTELLSYPDVNAIRGNTRHEISISDNSRATIGLECPGGICTTAGNRVSKNGGPGVNMRLVHNEPSWTIPAQRVSWGSSSTPPTGAFEQPALVDARDALDHNPAPNAGRLNGGPNDCDIVIPEGGGGAGFDAGAALTRSGQGDGAPSGGAPHGGAEGGSGLDPETEAWVRARLAAMRQALAANPASDTASAVVHRLYALQRLDRDDVLGEHATTMGRIGALHAVLATPAPLPPRLRATAALVVAVHDLMRLDAAADAAALIAATEALVEGEGARRALVLASASVDEASGDYAGALSRLEGLLATLGPEDEALARDVEVTMTRLASLMGGGGLREAVARAARAEAGVVSASEADGFVLEAARPNPAEGTAVVPLVLARPAEVEAAAYDALGRRVAVLASGRYEAGRHALVLDGASLPAGVYLVRATVRAEGGGVRILTERVTLMR